jgi:hypothetical protein
MKSLHKLVLSSSLTAIGLLGLQGSAMALTALNANICQLTDLTPGMIRSTGFIQNISANSRDVICPVVRIGPAPAAGWSVYVDGNLPVALPVGLGVRCQLESWDYTNHFMGAVSFEANAAGNFDRLLTLAADQVPFYSHQVVTCRLPTNTSLFDIEPTTP